VRQVLVSIIKEVSSEADRRRYDTYALRSFVEDNRQLTWCPSPGCEHAVEVRAEIGVDPLDISCKCGAAFCFQCKEEAHRPVRTITRAVPSVQLPAAPVQRPPDSCIND
jgi:ariadne-1